MLSNGTLLAWGRNNSGQLGVGGSTTSRTTPVPVQNLGPTRVRAVAAGDNHSLALLSDGTLLTWGNNSSGELGDGTTIDRATPAPVQDLIRVKAMAGGRRHSLALTATGVVRAWGDNSDGQLGNGTTTDRSLPVTVQNLDGVTAVAASGVHSLGLTAGGRLRAWGNNTDGQLGDGTTNSPRVFPVDVTPPAVGVIAVAAGGDHNLALLDDGTVRAWGDNGRGQLGDGTETSRARPVRVLGVAGAFAVAAGGGYSLALQ